MLLQVHDELVFTCPEKLAEKAKKIITHHMEHPFSPESGLQLRVPIEVDMHIVDKWGEAK